MRPLGAMLSGLVAGVLAAPGGSRTWDVHAGIGHLDARSSVSNGTCPAPIKILTTAKVSSPFKPLNTTEISAIVDWLQSPVQGLNLTDHAAEGLKMTDNYIWHVEELKPNKTDVLAYLDDGKTFPRYARVVIFEGGKEVPKVSEYYVGPLPISGCTRIKPLEYFYNGANNNSILYNGRFVDSLSSSEMDAFITSVTTELADVMGNLTGLVYYGAEDPRTNATYFLPNPMSTDGTTATVWTPWRRNGLASYDQPSDIYFGWDFAGTDPSLWKLVGIVYNLVYYKTVEDFRDAYEAGRIIKTPDPALDDSFLRKNRKGTPRELENRFAPTILQPGGRRYKVDDANKYVEYMGWKFYTRFDRDVGIQFYDIKFKEERIMYELSLQDAIAQYAGNNPFQASTAYIDRYYGIGAQTGRLIPGYDCPYDATYWDSTFTSGLSSHTTNNSICIFETDTGTPITRHSDSSYIQATKGSKLIVRQIATVGNYDYLWDYAFYVDGSITVDAHASGYVQANYYRPDDEGKWGPRIQETISGTLHTHVMNFKADFDLVNTANTFMKTDIVVENITMPWFPGRGTFEMMRYNITEVQTEDDGLLPAPANGQTMYTIVNKDKKNKWGEPRGYRIIPGLSNVHLASQKSPFFLKSGEFAKQAFAVSRQHDTEPGSSAALNQNVPAAPLVEFWKFFDGEDMVQQDLVAWVNLGMHHYTRAEDIPNTLMTEAHSSVMFAPQNWGDTELTTDLQNAIIYEATKGSGLVQPDTNGVEVPSCLPMGAQDELLGVFEGVQIPDPYTKDA
ncbi:copper amine oxidase [Sarocladium strictum]